MRDANRVSGRERILVKRAYSRKISSDGDDGWDSWRNVSETGRLAWVFSRGGLREEKRRYSEERSGRDGREKRRGRGLLATQAHQ